MGYIRASRFGFRGRLLIDPKDGKHLQLLFLLNRGGWAKSSVIEDHDQKQAYSRFLVGTCILSKPIFTDIRSELKRVSADVRIEVNQIRDAILAEVTKCEIVEVDKFILAEKALVRAATKVLRTRKTGDASSSDGAVSALATVAPPSTRSDTYDRHYKRR